MLPEAPCLPFLVSAVLPRRAIRKGQLPAGLERVTDHLTLAKVTTMKMAVKQMLLYHTSKIRIKLVERTDGMNILYDRRWTMELL